MDLRYLEHRPIVTLLITCIVRAKNWSFIGYKLSVYSYFLFSQFSQYFGWNWESWTYLHRLISNRLFKTSSRLRYYSNLSHWFYDGLNHIFSLFLACSFHDIPLRFNMMTSLSIPFISYIKNWLSACIASLRVSSGYFHSNFSIQIFNTFLLLFNSWILCYY